MVLRVRSNASASAVIPAQNTNVGLGNTSNSSEAVPSSRGHLKSTTPRVSSARNVFWIEWRSAAEIHLEDDTGRTSFSVCVRYHKTTGRGKTHDKTRQDKINEARQGTTRQDKAGKKEKDRTRQDT